MMSSSNPKAAHLKNHHQKRHGSDVVCGAAWRSILEALTVAAGDRSPQVVSGAMDALPQVIELLFQVRDCYIGTLMIHACPSFAVILVV